MQQLELGSFTYTAASFHCYEPYWHLLFDCYANEVYDRYELIEDFTWDYVLEEKLYLPSNDITLETMWEMVEEFKQDNFVGGKL